MRIGFSIILVFAMVSDSFCQLLHDKQRFSRADTLQGAQRPARTCYDINYYHLDVRFDPAEKYISGNNLFRFTATRDFRVLQFDLFANLKIDKILYHHHALTFRREFNAVFVTLPGIVRKGRLEEFTVYYSGKPTEAKHAPWDGGIVFSKDSLGRPWIATACQGGGASIWWPNKDQQADEVDSALISITVPKGLQDVSNGRLRKITNIGEYTQFDWFVSSPINNYDIEANIGVYAHAEDTYQGEGGLLTIDYWPLAYHTAQAKAHWPVNVNTMLRAFEFWFGPYPFYQDGYKLIETPHLGMEHQSGTAYGNHFQNGYLGRDLSGTGWGLKWDFIVVHESGHEWFGNNITSKDIADMWIHESFTNYSESLFIESLFGKQAGQEYVHGTRKAILNDEPIVGPYNVNKEGSGDMYYKGRNMLNMVRTIINDDDRWRKILRGLNQTFHYQTVTYEQIVNYVQEQSGKDLKPVFDQYLHYKNIPVLEIRFSEGKAQGRWIADAPDFHMPARLRTKEGEFQFVELSTQFKNLNLPGMSKDNVVVDQFNYYIGVLAD